MQDGEKVMTIGNWKENVIVFMVLMKETKQTIGYEFNHLVNRK